MAELKKNELFAMHYVNKILTAILVRQENSELYHCFCILCICQPEMVSLAKNN